MFRYPVHWSLNALIGIVSTPSAAPVIIGSRLRRSATGSPRGAKRFVAEILDTVNADKTHRGYAIIERVNADLKDSALALLPFGVFTANAAWLVLATFRIGGSGLNRAGARSTMRFAASPLARFAATEPLSPASRHAR